MEINKINEVCCWSIVILVASGFFCMVFSEFIPVGANIVGFIIGATIVSFGVILVNFNNDCSEDKFFSFSVTIFFWYFGIYIVGMVTNYYFFTGMMKQFFYPVPFLCAFMILACFLDSKRKKAEEESKGAITPRLF